MKNKETFTLSLVISFCTILLALFMIICTKCIIKELTNVTESESYVVRCMIEEDAYEYSRDVIDAIESVKATTDEQREESNLTVEDGGSPKYETENYTVYGDLTDDCVQIKIGGQNYVLFLPTNE